MCGDWLSLPLRAASRHLLIGDGCFSLLVGQARYAEFAAELRRAATAEPVKVLRTALDALLWQANTLRDHEWHGRDPTSR